MAKPVNKQIEKQLDKVVGAGEQTSLIAYHRQPNTLLQSQATWRQKGLFDLTYSESYNRDATNLFDNWLAKTTMELWQTKPKDKEGFVWCSFTDIGKVIYKKDRLDPDQYKNIKEGLLRLGGNMLPYSKLSDKGTISIGLIQFLEVLFDTNITPAEMDKLNANEKIGTMLLSLPAEGVKLEAGKEDKGGFRITKIGLRPNQILMTDIAGKGQGYTHLKNEAIADLRKSLGEAGTKWFDYISQHKTEKGKIKLATIIRRFGWVDKLKHNGRPACLELAIKGFKECVAIDQIFDKQVIKNKLEGSYYIPETEMFVFHRTRKWVNKVIADKRISDKPDSHYIKRLKALMEKNEWNITTVATKLDVSREYLGKVLGGKVKTGEKFIEKVRDFTG